MSTLGLVSRCSFFSRKDTTAGLGSYKAVGTPFQAMTNLSLKVSCDVLVLSFEYKMLYVETLLSTVMLSGEITTIAESRSLTKPVLFLRNISQRKVLYACYNCQNKVTSAYVRS